MFFDYRLGIEKPEARLSPLIGDIFERLVKELNELAVEKDMQPLNYQRSEDFFIDYDQGNIYFSDRIAAILSTLENWERYETTLKMKMVNEAIRPYQIPEALKQEIVTKVDELKKQG